MQDATAPETPPADGPPARDRYIPIGKAELVAALLRREGLPPDRAATLERLARWFSLLFHLEFFARREALKDLYTRLDPDQPGKAPLAAEAGLRQRLFKELEPALIAANFRPLTAAELDPDANCHGRVGARIVVPHETYDEVRFYGRGRRTRRIALRRWFGLRQREVEAPVYDFVVFCAAASTDPAIPARLRGRLRPGGLYLKLFRDIPQADLATLYPNAKVVMKLLDKLVIGVPAVVGGVPILLNIVPTLTVLLIVLGAYLGISGTVEEDSVKQALAALSGLGALGGFLVRQWTKYERQKLRYQKQVLDNAYFNNINNNRGFFDFVIGASENSEAKEALLAYAFLADHPEPLSPEVLDAEIEAFLRGLTGADVDFERDDALRKLRDFGLLTETEAGLDVVGPALAEERCRAAWAELAERVTRPGKPAIIAAETAAE